MCDALLPYNTRFLPAGFIDNSFVSKFPISISIKVQYGTLRDYTPLNDVWVMVLVVACFLALLLLVGHHRKYIGKMSRKFFLPTNREDKPGQKTPCERSLPILSALTLIASSGLVSFAYLHATYDLASSRFYIWSVLLLCLGGFLGYYVLRWLLYSFVNWVFFDRHQRQQWMGGFSLLMIYEAVVAYLLMSAAIFYHLPLYETGLAVAICYGMLRLLVIPYTKRIFFPDFYGLLHLFAYLCTLEMLPLLALWKFGAFWSSQLVMR